jgi:hypothetical protein
MIFASMVGGYRWIPHTHDDVEIKENENIRVFDTYFLHAVGSNLEDYGRQGVMVARQTNERTIVQTTDTRQRYF